MARWSPHPFTLRQLQYLLAIAEHGSFRRAAEACAISQPSLSAQVAQLEEALGVVIFERLSRGVIATKAGEAILERARRLLVDADDLLAAADRTRDPFAGTLRIGVIPTIAPYLLPEVAPVLRAKYPRLRVLWSEEKTRDLVRSLEDGAIDAAILALESELGDLAHEPLGRDPFVLAMAPEHPLARRDTPARLEQLEGETVLLLDDGHCFRDQALSVCQRAGADEASVRATSLPTLTQMVAGGSGITLLPKLALAAENRSHFLAIRPFGPRGPARTLALAWRKTSPLEPTLRTLADAIRTEVGKTIEHAGR